MEQTFDSRGRLLDAAEILFGDKGVQATSIRDITQKAETNLAAVNYHFRSKEGLIAAVLARRAAPVNAERLRMLDELEQAGKAALTVEGILRAFFEPIWMLMEETPQFMRFASRMISEPDQNLRKILLAEFAGVAQRFQQALRRALPAAAEMDVWLGVGLIVGSMSYLCTNSADVEILTSGEKRAYQFRILLDKMVRFSAAGLRALEVQ